MKNYLIIFIIAAFINPLLGQGLLTKVLVASINTSFYYNGDIDLIEQDLNLFGIGGQNLLFTIDANNDFMMKKNIFNENLGFNIIKKGSLNSINTNSSGTTFISCKTSDEVCFTVYTDQAPAKKIASVSNNLFVADIITITPSTENGYVRVGLQGAKQILDINTMNYRPWYPVSYVYGYPTVTSQAGDT
jgi:hypothetical protein